MPSRPALLLVLTAFLCGPVAAEPTEPSSGARSCVVAEVSSVDAASGGQALYRIAFQNLCGTPRSFFWCADHPRLPVPAAVACAASRGLGTEVRQLIRVRREYQWHLPAGARILYRDCAAQEFPTPEFGCESAPPPAPRR